ncbi:MAG: ABC transporter substrate-binding protein [Candidatus Hodarchaeota archaeon]
MKNSRTFAKVLTLVLIFTMLGNLADLVSAQEKPEPLFYCSLVAPTNNPARAQYAQLIEKELPKIGVQAELDLLSWYPLLYRMGALTEVGPYNEGGFDMGLIGFNINPTSHPSGTLNSLFGRESVAPRGYNMAMWTDSDYSGNAEFYNTRNVTEANALLDQTFLEIDIEKNGENMRNYQKLFYDAQPLSFVYVEYRVHPITKGLYGYDPNFYPFTSYETQWLSDDYDGTAADTVVLANSAAPNAFNTRIVRDVYNQYAAGPVQDFLAGLTPSKDMFLPEDVDREQWMKENFHDVYGTSKYLELYPRIAKELGTYSADGLTYTIEIRDDVYFHDGHRLDAWDVAFSYQTFIIPDVGSPGYSTMRRAWGDDGQGTYGGNYSFIVTDENTDGFYETIAFKFNQTFSPWQDYIQSAIFPEHILGDPVDHGFVGGVFDPDNTWLVPPADFNTHSYNTGNPADDGGLVGPIGAGSLVFWDRDITAGTVDLRKFDGVKWDDTAKEWVTDANNKHYLVADGLLDKAYTNAKIVPSSLDGALPELKAGAMNIIDPQFTMNNIVPELQTYEKANVVLNIAGGWQALWYNPKFKLADGSYPFQKLGVRHAISHLIPREDIVTYLLAGLGVECFSPVPITHAWGALPEEDMIEFKKTVKATDGSFPEKDATTAYDDFNLETAWDWMETEGYDMEPFRDYYKVETAAPGFEFIIAVTAVLGVVLIMGKKRR